MTLPQWRLTDRQVEASAKKGFDYFKLPDGRFILKRDTDEARVWPHIDGFLSCFRRKGQYVKHKKFVDLERAIDRHFGD